MAEIKCINKDAPTSVWATARMPYISPAHGGQQPVFVDSKAQRGAPVKIAGEWEGHYPSLVGVAGELVARAGTGWAVRFGGVDGEMFFNTEPGMQQLVFLPAEIPIEEDSLEQIEED